MRENFGFEGLKVYQKAIELTDKVFSISNGFSKRVQFSLGEQIRRASLSIPNNIAEGSGRRHRAEKKQFFQTALSSAFECVPILTIALRQNEITQQDYDQIYESCYEISKMVSGLIKSVDKMLNAKN